MSDYEYDDIEDDEEFDEIIYPEDADDDGKYDEFNNLKEDADDEDGEEEEEEDEDDIVEDLTPIKDNVKTYYGDDRISSKRMSKYEYDRLVGSLASMIGIENFKVNPKVFEIYYQSNNETLDSDTEIAKFWLDNSKKIPFPIKLKREMMDKSIEIFDIEEMILPKELEII